MPKADFAAGIEAAVRPKPTPEESHRARRQPGGHGRTARARTPRVRS